MKRFVVRALDGVGVLTALTVAGGALHWLFGMSLWLSVPLGLLAAFPLLRDWNPFSWIAWRIIAADEALSRDIMGSDDESPLPKGFRVW